MTIIANPQNSRGLESCEIQEIVDFLGCQSGTIPEFIVN
jgi:hypothetical protein